MGRINLASTPCCGSIDRSYDVSSSTTSATGWIHQPGGDYVPTPEDFQLEKFQLAVGTCPDCNGTFLKWLDQFGHFNQDAQRWEWDFSEAQRFFSAMPKERIDDMKSDNISLRKITRIFREIGAPLRGLLLGQRTLRK